MAHLSKLKSAGTDRRFEFDREFDHVKTSDAYVFQYA
jgi:hypothetical protein